MTNFESRAIQVLRDADYRITSPRLSVVKVLGETHRALTAYEIHEKAIGLGDKVDVVSVYRILATLLSLRLIYRIADPEGYFPRKSGAIDNPDERTALIYDERNEVLSEVTLTSAAEKAIASFTSTLGFEVTDYTLLINGAFVQQKT